MVDSANHERSSSRVVDYHFRHLYRIDVQLLLDSGR